MNEDEMIGLIKPGWYTNQAGEIFYVGVPGTAM